jgi:hypothetical protein
MPQDIQYQDNKIIQDINVTIFLLGGSSVETSPEKEL